MRGASGRCAERKSTGLFAASKPTDRELLTPHCYKLSDKRMEAYFRDVADNAECTAGVETLLLCVNTGLFKLTALE